MLWVFPAPLARLAGAGIESCIDGQLFDRVESLQGPRKASKVAIVLSPMPSILKSRSFWVLKSRWLSMWPYDLFSDPLEVRALIEENVVLHGAAQGDRVIYVALDVYKEKLA